MGRCPLSRRLSTVPRGWMFAITGLFFAALLLVQWQYYASIPHSDRVAKGVQDPLHPSDVIVSQDEHEVNKKITDGLNQQIQVLQNKLKRKMDLLSKVENMGKEEKISILKEFSQDIDETETYLRMQIEKAAILQPHQYRNEYEVPPFASFTRKLIFRLHTGLIKQPEFVLPFYHDINADLSEVIETATKKINDREVEFVEGFYRMQHQSGTQYELTFKSTVNASAPLHLLTLFRPYGPLQTVTTKLSDAVETVYIIVPLQGRGDSFKRFVDNFEEVAIMGDGHVHLTVVCYGSEALNDAREILAGMEKKTNFNAYHIVEGNSGEFSRGRALQEGTKKLPDKNVLMFFCDVDMSFTSHFLFQCRSQARSGSRVFYPVVFSLYNPEIVYKGKIIPSLKDQQVIKRDNGFWRDFGFGMTCQYKDDFYNIGGFDLTIKGWGSEDVLLYRKYSRSTRYQVVRAPVSSLFHHWHPKHCDKSLSLEQYNACLRTRSINEGSQIQLGMLYLQNKEN